jgi:hypothetical protein
LLSHELLACVGVIGCGDQLPTKCLENLLACLCCHPRLEVV